MHIKEYLGYILIQEVFMDYTDMFKFFRSPEEIRAFNNGKKEILLVLNNMLNSTCTYRGMYENIKEYVEKEMKNISG
jgi:hypothetical protein